ncbi:MAG TPA: hypothetical protein VNQ90_19780 [Chthoniobacteraceae bacterium]|nr:hypothetical protein [Chthoniobacteraceae bacterium]
MKWLEVREHCGVELPELGLWLDARAARPFSFVSHAHGDHIAKHREVLFTPATARLMRARLPGQRVEHPVAFGERFTHERLPGVGLKLLPAGHLLGSAQLYLETGDQSLLYTGDFKLRPGRTAETATFCHADTLVMETTFGKPEYCFPPTEEVVTAIADFCRETRRDGAVPVLLAYSLGKAQELVASLIAHGLRPALHRSLWKMTELYRELLPGFPSGYTLCRESGADEELLPGMETTEAEVVLVSPQAVRNGWLERYPRRRVAIVSGWAIDESARYRYGVDAAFPLSDHAGYDDLLRYVELVAPRRVLTLHGFAREFAADLRQRGVEAWALAGADQLEFRFGG